MGARARCLVLGLALLVSACTTATPADVATPTPPPAPSTPTAPVTPAECPDPADTPTSGASYEFADGAAWARVCGTSASGTGQDPGLSRVLNSPPDALVTNLDGLIDFANGLPTNTANMACTADLGPSYTIMVGYPDGSTELITGELYGCGMFGDRLGARQLLTDFGNRLRAQRDALPDLAPPALNCADPTAGDIFVQPSLQQTTSAEVVRYDNGAVARMTITEWAQLVETIQAESTPPPPQAPGSQTTSFGPAIEIDARNDQCETLTLQVSEGRVHWSAPGGGPMIWKPTDDDLSILQPYLDWAKVR